MFFVVKSLKRHLEVLLVLPLSSRVSLGSAARARRTRPAGRVCAEQGLRMQVEPREYGPNLRETVQTKLREAVENTCSERYGYILKIFNVDTERLQGRIESTGMQPSRGGTATFVVNYDAVVFKPFKNEVLIGEVKSVAQQGVFCQCGPMQVFISKANLADESNGLKWFGDRTPACWMSDNEKWVVQEKTRLRIRLMGVRLSNDLSKSRSVCLCVCVCARSLFLPHAAAEEGEACDLARGRVVSVCRSRVRVRQSVKQSAARHDELVFTAPSVSSRTTFLATLTMTNKRGGPGRRIAST